MKTTVAPSKNEMTIRRTVKILLVGFALVIAFNASAPSASAAISCSQALNLSDTYSALGNIAFYVYHSPALAAYYYGKAEGVLAAC